MNGWAVSLNYISLIGGTDAPTGTTPVGCISAAPDGLGVPPLRVEDVIYPQRDGAEFFYDWYQPRIITIDRATVCSDGCSSCPTARVKMAQLMGAWSRHCDNAELVIFTDCHDSDSSVTGSARAFIGPFGVVGRPRVATSQWLPGKSHCGVATLRFDSVDHRLYILDADGTPGSGEVCVSLSPVISARSRCYPRCYDTCSVEGGGMAYTLESSSVTGIDPTSTDNYGTLCSPFTVTFTGPLSFPTLENITTSEEFTYEGVLSAGQTITVNTATGVATDQDGIARTYLLSGSTRMQLGVGENVIRLRSQGASDSGTASICYRPAVLSG